MRTEWLSVEDIAEELNVSVSTVRSWIRNKRLKAVRIGRDYRIKRADYEKFLEERTTMDEEDERY
jgi:excisionase family DNA binding protein